MQVEASNRLKLLWSKAMVVSVKEKARQEPCQVGVMETNASKPLMTCRKTRDVIKTRGS